MKATNKPKLNVRLLRKIQKHILEEPRRFLMSCSVLKADSARQWKRGVGPWTPDASKVMPPCGTAACIAGWADIFTGGNGEGHMDLIARAATALGVKEHGRWSGHTLFSARDWPEPFATRYSKATRPYLRAKIAAARIEWLITKGE